MACDSRRRNFFTSAFPADQEASILGAPGAGEEFLGALFDLARQQPIPEGKADRLAAAAATSAIKARAAQRGITLFPHQDAAPRPDVQQGWLAVLDCLDAVEKGTPLPPLAADLRQTTAFQALTRTPTMDWAWSAPLTGATRQQLRAQWAADPARVSALISDPAALGDEVHAPWLRAVTEAVVADPQAPPSLGAAARHYLLLDEEGMLAPEERAGWAQALGTVAGVGITSGHQGARFVCPRCGLWSRTLHRCLPAVAALKERAAVAAAVGLADPLYAGERSDQSPMGELDRQLEPWLRDGREPPPGSGAALGLAAARAVDRAWVQGMIELEARFEKLTPNDEQQLRDATLRAPVVFAGRHCIWDNGALYEEGVYRAQAHWDQWRRDRGSMLYNTEREAYALAAIDSSQMLALMVGRTVPLSKVRVDTARHPELFEQTPVPLARMTTGREVADPCGCVFYCTSIMDGTITFQRKHQGSRSCVHPHTRTYSQSDPNPLTCINPRRPRYTLPEWPTRQQEAPDGL